jgi:hypothetical protein
MAMPAKASAASNVLIPRRRFNERPALIAEIENLRDRSTLCPSASLATLMYLFVPTTSACKLLAYAFESRRGKRVRSGASERYGFTLRNVLRCIIREILRLGQYRPNKKPRHIAGFETNIAIFCS